MDSQDQETRSEKVSKLLGDMPRSLEIWGMAVAALIFAALIAAVCFIPDPYSDSGEAIIMHLLRKWT